MRGAEVPWYEQGACREADDTLFFHPDGETGSAKAQRINQAKAVCHGCDAILACRTYALKKREGYGIWGGLSEDERAAILAGKKETKELVLEPVAFAPTKPQRTLDPAIVAGHIRTLIAAGFTPGAIARFSGVSPETVRAIVKGVGREVYVATAEKLMSVRVQEVAA